MVFGYDVGVFNYYLFVMFYNCIDKVICVLGFLLWFFDSCGGFEFQVKKDNGDFVGKLNWVDVSVVNWFQ